MDRLAKAIKLWALAAKAVRPGLVLKPTREKTKGRTVRRWMRASAEETPSPAQPKAAPMPQDLTTLTRAQTNSAIRTLAKLPLKELRRRQDLVSAQLRTASTRRDEKALGNLQVMQDHLTAAVMRREFGGTAPPKGRKRKAEGEPTRKQPEKAPAPPKATEEPPEHATVVQRLADAFEKELVKLHEQGINVFGGYAMPDTWSYGVVYEHAGKRPDSELQWAVGDELVRRGVLKPDRRHHRQVGRVDDEGYCRVSRGWMNRRLRLGVQKGLLTTERRKRLKGKTFGLPGERAYPMPDKAHARNALARAAQQLKAGNLTQEEHERIVRKARRILAGKERKPEEIGKRIVMSSKSRLAKAIMLWKAVTKAGQVARKAVPTRLAYRGFSEHPEGGHALTLMEVSGPSTPGGKPYRSKPFPTDRITKVHFRGDFADDPSHGHYHVKTAHVAGGGYDVIMPKEHAAQITRHIQKPPLRKTPRATASPTRASTPSAPAAPFITLGRMHSTLSPASEAFVTGARKEPKRPPGGPPPVKGLRKAVELWKAAQSKPKRLHSSIQGIELHEGATYEGTSKDVSKPWSGKEKPQTSFTHRITHARPTWAGRRLAQHLKERGWQAGDAWSHPADHGLKAQLEAVSPEDHSHTFHFMSDLHSSHPRFKGMKKLSQ